MNPENIPYPESPDAPEQAPINPYTCEGKPIEVVPIQRLTKPVIGTNTFIFIAASAVFDSLNIGFDGYEPKFLKVNYFDFFEFIYYVTRSVISHLQTSAPLTIIEGNERKISMSWLMLFTEPLTPITEEEQLWLKEITETIEAKDEGDLAFRIPDSMMNNFYINLKRSPHLNIENLEILLREVR